MQFTMWAGLWDFVVFSFNRADKAFEIFLNLTLNATILFEGWQAGGYQGLFFWLAQVAFSAGRT